MCPEEISLTHKFLFKLVRECYNLENQYFVTTYQDVPLLCASLALWHIFDLNFFDKILPILMNSFILSLFPTIFFLKVCNFLWCWCAIIHPHFSLIRNIFQIRVILRLIASFHIFQIWSLRFFVRFQLTLSKQSFWLVQYRSFNSYSMWIKYIFQVYVCNIWVFQHESWCSKFHGKYTNALAFIQFDNYMRSGAPKLALSYKV